MYFDKEYKYFTLLGKIWEGIKMKIAKTKW